MSKKIIVVVAMAVLFVLIGHTCQSIKAQPGLRGEIAVTDSVERDTFPAESLIHTRIVFDSTWFDSSLVDTSIIDTSEWDTFRYELRPPPHLW